MEWKKWFRRVLVRLRALCSGGIYYIGGSEVLPPPLVGQEEADCIARLMEGDAAARDTLVEHNLRLVVYIARKFENTGVGVEDLISIGTIGLMKAVGTYKTDKNVKLATYASRCIENEILMHLRKVSGHRAEVSFDEPLSSDWDGWETDELKDRADYERYFREQFQLELLIQQHPYEEEALNEMLNLVVDTVCSKRKTIRIASDDKPLEVVKSVFMKLDREHISLVLSNMKDNTTLIRNMKQYLLAALYNAPLTINNYYSSLVQHHMATGQI